jgi:arginyl-tRNA synthetase
MIKEDLEKILGFKVEATENSDFGDYSSNVALQFKTQKSKIKITTQNLNARQIAEEMVEKLKNNKELTNLVDRIEIAGPGFINFWLTRRNLVNAGDLINKRFGDFTISSARSLSGAKMILDRISFGGVKELTEQTLLPARNR